MDKNEIAKTLNEIADILEIQEENPFRIRAYRNAVRTLENLSLNLDKLVKEEKLTELDGIGKDLAEKISLLSKNKQVKEFSDLKKSIPKGMLEMLEVSGLGAKKIKVLYKELKITSKKELEKACKQGKIAKLKGFGKKTEDNILNSLGHIEAYSQKHLWFSAMQIAHPILEDLRALKEVLKADIAGSLRRKKETVGDIDFVASSTSPKPRTSVFPPPL